MSHGANSELEKFFSYQKKNKFFIIDNAFQSYIIAQKIDLGERKL